MDTTANIIRKSKVLVGFGGLAEYGINVLTGEACALGLRLLCDVSDEGAELIDAFFGRPPAKLNDNWNSMVGDSPATGSVMLPRDTLRDIMVFALATHGYPWVCYREHEYTVTGWFEDPRLVAQYRVLFEEHRFFYNPRAGGSSARNTHEFTGRTE